ncbi:hypothetical protein FHU36_002336 [Nonomuraea muscovyensis]|uniref:Uncharacterized protein n=2 Tax=Nonomuraea muscovyensis TaxID=1124761 RepID=A0A7X0EVG4_9ACTN|nr:hypothetical protein [Nonomuraea muscovyensis]
MARMPVRRPRATAPVARRVPAPVPTTDTITERACRMARFAAGARRVIVRAALVGGLVVAGWLLAVLFGASFAAPASAAAVATVPAPAAPTAADSTAVTGAGAPQTVTGPFEGGFPTADGTVSAPDNAEAMAGLTVDGLTSQSDPGLPTPSTASSMLDTGGLVPNGGGSGPSGPCAGDIARSVYDPRIEARRAHLACVLPPVVRTAADDPSFSPD